MENQDSWLATLANLCQIASFQMNVQEVGNDAIMQHLERQDHILDEQTNNYLKKIIKQNEEILRKLDKLAGVI
jgi:hypothetical protein